MAIFRYKAIDDGGRVHSGKLDAANESELEQRIIRMDMELIKCKYVEDKRAVSRSGKITRQDLINLCFHMEQLTRSGVSIIDGLEDLRDSVEQANFRAIIASLVDDIEAGKKLSEALSEHPDVFDEMFVNLIAAGEESGQLSEVFLSLNEMIKWQDEIITTTKKLMMMPMFVGLAVFCVIGFLMVYLVPQLISFIEGIGQELPIHTRALIATSQFTVDYWPLFTILPVAIFALLKLIVSVNSKARFQLDSMKLKIWKIGPVLKKIILSRFVSFFGMMYKAGIPVLQCIEICERVTGNEAVKLALQKAREDIAEGKGVSASFYSTGLFPPLVVRMLRVGETTGQLDEALKNVGYFYDRDIKESIEKVQAMIQPTMTVFLGLILGWVMMSVMGPVYDSITTLAT